jgi:hypothetical protein
LFVQDALFHIRRIVYKQHPNNKKNQNNNIPVSENFQNRVGVGQVFKYAHDSKI